MIMGSPLWQRGVRGDFINIFDSIGVKVEETQNPKRDKDPNPLICNWSFENLSFEFILDLVFSLPARSRFGEGRGLEFECGASGN
jgi:hypothetical protein